MLRLIWTLSIYVRSFMRRFMPTNVALDALRTRRGLKWGVPAMSLAAVYLFIARILTVLINDGAPKWLYLLVLICIWNAVKFVANGIVSIGLLARARIAERRARSLSQQQAEQSVSV